jgi:hypothetical protein
VENGEVMPFYEHACIGRSRDGTFCESDGSWGGYVAKRRVIG